MVNDPDSDCCKLAQQFACLSRARRLSNSEAAKAHAMRRYEKSVTRHF